MRIILSLLAIAGLASAGAAQAQSQSRPQTPARTSAPAVAPVRIAASPVNPYESAIAAFEAADRVRPPAACSTLFLGSSSMRLWSSLASDFSDRPVINRGFGGSRIADSIHYFDRIVTPYRPRAIVFYAGENDLDEGRTPQDVFGDFALFLARKRERLGNTPVWFVSIKPSPTRWAQRGAQIEVNAKVQELARYAEDLGFIDVASPMLTPGGLPKEIFGPDRLHMRPAGYRIWTAVVRAALQDVPPPAHCR